MTLFRVIDIETTGFEPPPEDAVVEIGFASFLHPGDEVDGPYSNLVNPMRQIPATASAIHHIVDEDLAHIMAEWPLDFLPFFQKPDVFVAHNVKFERQWITDEITGGKPWICTYKCALRLWPDAPAHSNQTLRYWRKPTGLNRELAEPAHRAGPDAYVTAHLLVEMLKATPVDQLIAWSAEPALLIRVGFGKHRGTLWAEVDDGYLRWILGQDFEGDVLFTARHHLEKRAQR